MKKMLLIIPYYFGYDKYIKRAFELRGYKVQIIYENLDEVNYFYRFVYAYCGKLKETFIDRYYSKKISNRSYDFILTIRGESLTENIIKSVREKNPSADYVLYLWDSVKNNTNSLMLSKYFDNILTFDMNDAKERGWEYRPLFFCEESERSKKIKRKYDVAYVSSLHSRRIKIFNKLKSICKDKNLNMFSQLYSKKLIYYKQKYINKNPDYIGLNNNDVNHKPLSLSETQKIYGDSDIIVDYAHPNQSGLTMRTIESIGHRCKLVTNNKNIVNEPFYSENNIYVYDENDFGIPLSFLKKDYEELDFETRRYFSLDGWCESLLKNCKSNIEM